MRRASLVSYLIKQKRLAVAIRRDTGIRRRARLTGASVTPRMASRRTTAVLDGYLTSQLTTALTDCRVLCVTAA